MVAVLDTLELLSMYDSGTAGDFKCSRGPVRALFAGSDDVLAPGSVGSRGGGLAGHPTAAIITIAGVNHSFQKRAAEDEGMPAVSAPALTRLVPLWLVNHLARQ